MYKPHVSLAAVFQSLALALGMAFAGFPPRPKSNGRTPVKPLHPSSGPSRTASIERELDEIVKYYPPGP